MYIRATRDKAYERLHLKVFDISTALVVATCSLNSNSFCANREEANGIWKLCDASSNLALLGVPVRWQFVTRLSGRVGLPLCCRWTWLEELVVD